MRYPLGLQTGRFFGGLLPASLLCILLAGCGGGGGSSSASTAPVTSPTLPPNPTPVPAVTSVSAPALQNFTVTLAENTASLAVGGTVTYTLTLTNTSAVTATVIVNVVNGMTVPKAALQVTNSSGAIVYPVVHPVISHADPPPPPSLGLPATLAPGQSLTAITQAVSAFAVAGTYQATATFTVAANATDAVQTVTLSPLSVTVQ